MKTRAFITILFIISFVYQPKLFGINYDHVLEHVNRTPLSVTNSKAMLSNYLTSPFKHKEDKFASIYYWLAKNISYNDALAKKTLYYEDLDEIIDYIMKTKSGVCQHYAELFAELSKIAGLEAYVVHGYTQENGKVDELSHAWNIIRISGKWYFIDATWAGAIVKASSKNVFPKRHFMLKPEENIMHRMPFDPIWQVLSSPIKYDDFNIGKINPNKKGKFNYNELINDYSQLTHEMQFITVMQRMEANGTFNSLVKREYDLNERNLMVVKQNKQTVKYNSGTKSYNQGMKYLNQYVKIRNKHFKDKHYNKKKLIALLDSSSTNLKKASTYFASIYTKESEMKEYIKKNNSNINSSMEMILKERNLVEKFFRRN